MEENWYESYLNDLSEKQEEEREYESSLIEEYYGINNKTKEMKTREEIKEEIKDMNMEEVFAYLANLSPEEQELAHTLVFADWY